MEMCLRLFFSGKRLFFLPFCVSLERLDGTNELPLVVEAAMMTTSAVLSFCNANILYFYGATFWSQNTTPEFLGMSTHSIKSGISRMKCFSTLIY